MKTSLKKLTALLLTLLLALSLAACGGADDDDDTDLTDFIPEAIIPDFRRRLEERSANK